MNIQFVFLGMCKIFAKRWNASVDDAIIAGLLHDIGKSQSKKEMLSLCMRNNITIYDFELWENPIALHGKIGSFLFEKEFNKNEPERFNQISHAISCHVAGSDDMNLLDKIVFIADNIEPNKDSELYKKFKDNSIDSPDDYLKLIIDKKIARSISKRRELNPMTQATNETLER